MTTRGIASLLVVVAMTSSLDLRAQEPQDLAEGTRIRVLAPGTGKAGFKGTLVARDSQELTLQVKHDRDPVVIPRSQVTRLYISAGRGRGKAAAIGALVGVTVAGALVLSGASGFGCDSSECLCSGDGCMQLLGLLGAPAAATGALVGALVAPEQWRELPLHPPGPASMLSSERIRVGIVPVRGGGVRFVASCTF